MLCRQQNIHSYPSLIIYPQKEKYHGSRELDAMVQHVLQMLPNNVIKLRSTDFIEVISREELTSLPWLVFACKSHKNCIHKDDMKKLAIILEHLVNIGEVDIENEKQICDIIDCKSSVTYYFNLSLALPKTEQRSVSIDDVETVEIVKKVLQLLPEPEDVTEEKFEEIRSSTKSLTSSPWLIQFTKNKTSPFDEDVDLKRLKALLPEVMLGLFDCLHHMSTCSSMYVQKFPTFILFKPGGMYEFHHGRITAYDIARFSREALSSQVHTLTPEHFPQILESSEAWFIDFFAPWCPPCMQFLPEWRKASHSSGHLVKFGTVDCSIHGTLCRKYNINSYPTAILYNHSVPHKFIGSHSHHQIEEFVEDILHPLVIILNPELFEKLIKDKKDDEIWVVDFYAPWCGPCQQLAPQWRKLAKMLVRSPSVRIAEIDCQTYYSLCNTNGVNSYPTIRLYPRGKMGPNRFYSFNGWSRDASSLQAWIYNFLPSKVQSLTSSLFKEVLADSEPWVIDFYAPWCSHCQTFAPEFEKIAEVLKGEVKVGKINCEEFPNICRQATVRAYPTVVFYQGAQRGKTQNPIAEEIHTLTFNGVISFLEEKLTINIQRVKHDEL
ncbi:DnaJ-like protein subfamily C member 10, partial [Stegodyphus mimosarum]